MALTEPQNMCSVTQYSLRPFSRNKSPYEPCLIFFPVKVELKTNVITVTNILTSATRSCLWYLARAVDLWFVVSIAQKCYFHILQGNHLFRSVYVL